MHLRNTLIGTECADKEILPHLPERNNSVKIEPVTNNDNSQNLNEQQLDLSIPASLNHFEEETEDDEMSDEDEKAVVKKCT